MLLLLHWLFLWAAVSATIQWVQHTSIRQGDIPINTLLILSSAGWSCQQHPPIEQHLWHSGTHPELINVSVSNIRCVQHPQVNLIYYTYVLWCWNFGCFGFMYFVFCDSIQLRVFFLFLFLLLENLVFHFGLRDLAHILPSLLIYIFLLS